MTTSNLFHKAYCSKSITLDKNDKSLDKAPCCYAPWLYSDSLECLTFLIKCSRYEYYVIVLDQQSSNNALAKKSFFEIIKKMFEVKNKRAIVTGGGQGIGKAIVQKLLENGSKVCIADLASSKGAATAEEFQKEFGLDTDGWEQRYNSIAWQ